MIVGQLDGKVAFITGVARGQGRSHAVRLAQEGADIIGIDVCADVETAAYPGATEADLAETVRAVEALDRRIIASKADVRDFESIEKAVDEGVAQLGRLDIVSANAGILSFGATIDLTEDEWGQMIDTNLTGVWRTCKATARHLIDGGRGGSIVITNSVGGLAGIPGVAHYVAAKHGLVGLMHSLALELAPHKIRVNGIHPTNVNTVMLHNDALYKRFAPDVEGLTTEQFAVISQSRQAMPFPWVEPTDISNALVFLVSDQGRYITGVSLPVDLGCVIV